MRYTPIQQSAEIAEKRREREREKEVARTRLFPFLYFYFLTGAQGSGIRANTGTLLRYRYTVPTTISSIIFLHFC